MTKAVLVTGGAGYIGSHACKLLKAAGFLPVTYDSLVTGWTEAVRFGPLERGDLLERDRLDAVFARWQPVAVVHFAALTQVGESMAEPGRYWRNNLCGSLNLVEAAVAAGVDNFVFSSTCAVHGDQDGVLLDEDSPLAPLNAYAGSKRAVEDVLRDFGARHGVRSVIFRYFNVAGADPEADIGEFHRPETHLVPLLLDAIAGRRPALTLHGTDYPTADGTCVRDYVHVLDLVEAHLAGLDLLMSGGASRVFSLGTGTGFSVREVIDAAAAVTNAPVPVVEGPRRAGDAVRLVCGSDRARRELGWTPRRSAMREMIADAWRWHQTGGYRAD
ncbi:MAG: UDP-glucose 4-epimerase GalE [Gemmobacter sp.]